MCFIEKLGEKQKYCTINSVNVDRVSRNSLLVN